MDRSSVLATASHEVDERTVVIAVEGELDLAAAPHLKWALVDQFGAGRSQLVLDLSAVTFMDSTALGVLIGIDRNLSHGERLAIACPQPDVAKIFELTGLYAALKIFDELGDAVAYVQGKVAGDE